MEKVNKYCPSCDKDLSIDNFYTKGKNSNTNTQYYDSKCKNCINDKRFTAMNERIKKELKNQGREYSCENCGYNKNYSALHFHHNTEEKNFGISAIRDQSISNEDFSYELYICIVLCANCHAEYHNPNRRIT